MIKYRGIEGFYRMIYSPKPLINLLTAGYIAPLREAGKPPTSSSTDSSTSSHGRYASQEDQRRHMGDPGRVERTTIVLCGFK